MKEIKHLVVVASNYPSAARPTYGTFVRQFAHAVARQGVKCTVIQPVAVHVTWGSTGFPVHALEDAGGGMRVEVHRPRFLSVSARESFAVLGPLSPSRLTLHRFIAAVRRVLDQHRIRPDALYGHFLYLAGTAVVRIGRELGIPAFPCVGESDFWTIRPFGLYLAREHLAPACGFLANSSILKYRLIQELGVQGDRIGVFPNGANLAVFRPRHRLVARKRFGLPQDRFLVISVGGFSHRKGISRVGEAIDGVSGIGGVFVGSGPMRPRAGNTVLCNTLPHEDVPAILSACDVFVLPTLAEGSCNVLVEAMACGLPIISSEGEFNDDILDDGMSIRVDPLNISMIRQAILRVKNDPALRAGMAAAALNKSRNFDINDRAQRILNFMATHCQPG